MALGDDITLCLDIHTNLNNGYVRKNAKGCADAVKCFNDELRRRVLERMDEQIWMRAHNTWHGKDWTLEGPNLDGEPETDRYEPLPPHGVFPLSSYPMRFMSREKGWTDMDGLSKMELLQYVNQRLTPEMNDWVKSSPEFGPHRHMINTFDLQFHRIFPKE